MFRREVELSARDYSSCLWSVFSLFLVKPKPSIFPKALKSTVQMSSLPDCNKPASVQADCCRQPAWCFWCGRKQCPPAVAAQASCWAACLILAKWSWDQKSSLKDWTNTTKFKRKLLEKRKNALVQGYLTRYDFPNSNTTKGLWAKPMDLLCSGFMVSFQFHPGLDGKEMLVHLHVLYLYMQLYAMLSEGCVPSGIGDSPSNPLEQRAKEAL